MIKKILCLFMFFTLCFAAWAGENDTYSIKVTNADDMKVLDEAVVFSGNVVIDLKTSNKGDEAVSRQLSAQKVVINLDEKVLEASGDVKFKEGEDSSFNGDVVSLNWDNLDIVVFDGGNSTERKNASGTAVKFFSLGDRVSYSGNADSVFFKDGVVATREKDPYWSVRAKKIAIANSDLFFQNATLRIGRVPIFWFPFFFYPGSRLVINPAVGLSSSKGTFLNTTYEVYGTYPGLGVSGESASSSDEDGSASASIMSLLSSDEKGELVKDGPVYRKKDKNYKLSPVQQWAKDTGSYLAVFADAYYSRGLVLGYDTKNYTKDKSINFTSTGLVSYSKYFPYLSQDVDGNFRYSFDSSFSFSVGSTNMSFNIPMYSDPDVKIDFLNRITAFSLDGALGVEQSFPTTYSSDIDDYTMTFKASSSHNYKKFNFNISNLSGKIKYSWNSNKKKFIAETASLPYMVISSSGTLINASGKTKTVPAKFADKTVQKFVNLYRENYTSTSDLVKTTYSDIGSIKPYDVKALSYETTSGASNFTLSYSYNQTIDNSYTADLKHSSFYTYIDSAIKLSGKTSGQWFSFTESVKPIYTGKFKSGDFNELNFKLQSVLSASVPVAGISYNLTSNILAYENKAAEENYRWAKWDSTDVTVHNISFSKKFKNLSIGLKENLKPLTESLVPSASYSNNGFSASSDMTLYLHGDTFLDPRTAHFNASFGKGFFSAKFNNTMDFTKTGWTGYTGYQYLGLSFLESKLTFSEALNLVNEFKAKNMTLSAGLWGNSITMKYTGESFEKDSFNINLKYSLPAKYIWKNRIGLESTLNTGFTYDYKNKYGSSFFINFTMNFAIYKFIDLNVNVKSSNNGFYRYYDNDNFSFDLLWEDLLRSVDFFGNGRNNTQFNLSSIALSVVHHLEDWDLSFTASSSVKTNNNRKEFVPEITVMVQWKAIPELKTKGTWEK